MMRAYIAGKTRLISMVCAGLVGFSLGTGSRFLGIAAFILAIVFDAVSKLVTHKIEQNKNSYDHDLR